ncbi:MFS transporter [Motiliproteus sediminis]|uniref:MFS transporter n=1 Tax=Motiliproteus sediminis TaxID=1468178 RepID=UPI001AEFF8D1|nr:MFS transporter [Motiliproteus sediminis]
MSSCSASVLTPEQRWCYALPAAALALPTLPFYILLPVYYAEQTGLSLVSVGGLLLLARLIDVASDVMAARLCDRPLGRYGRKGWLALGALLSAVGLIALAHPDQDRPGLWLALFAAILYLGWTLIQIPYTAWLAGLEGSDQQRRELAARRERCGLIGLLLSALFPSLSALFGWQGGDLFQSLVWLTLLAGSITLTLLLWRVPEPARLALTADWRALFRLPLQRRLLLAWFINGLANAIPAVLFPLLVTVVLSRPETDRGMLLLIYFVSAAVALPLWIALARRWSDARSWCVAMMAAILVFASVPLLPLALLPFVLMVVFTGLCLGADLALPHSLQARLVRWEARRYQRFQPALHFAGASLVNKLALGIGVALAPALLALGSWEDSAPQQSSAAIWQLLVIYAWLPCVLKAVAIALIWRFPDLEESNE